MNRPGKGQYAAKAVMRSDGTVYQSIAEAVRVLATERGFVDAGTHTRLSRACRNQSKTVYGYRWKFV